MTRSSQERLHLEIALGYQFHDRDLLNLALTPPSTGLHPNNQRLEFLGDAILQSIVSELIFREKADWDEGAMSKLRGMLVCTETLCEWAHSLGLTLRIGPRSNKRGQGVAIRKPMADALEALLAAVYLDAKQSGKDPRPVLADIVETRFIEEVKQAFVGIWQERDSKTTLQERAAALSLPAPIYELADRSGPDHAPSFTVRVSVGKLEASGTGGSLKGAQTSAARMLLGQLGPEPQ